MRLEQLHYLIEVISCQSITKAAEKLYISQPALSSALIALEKELGTELLRRSAQGVFPTAAGIQILDQAQDIVDLVDSWKDLDRHAQLKRPQLMFCSLPPAYFLLEEYLREGFKRDFPMFDYLLSMADNHDIIPYIPQSRNIIGFGSFLENERSGIMVHAKKAGFKVEIFKEDYLALYVRADHPLLCEEEVHLTDLHKLVFSYGKKQCDPIPTTFQRYFNQDYQIVRCGDSQLLANGVYAENANIAMFFPRAFARRCMVENYMRELTVQEICIPIFHYVLCPNNPIWADIDDVAASATKFLCSVMD